MFANLHVALYVNVQHETHPVDVDTGSVFGHPLQYPTALPKSCILECVHCFKLVEYWHPAVAAQNSLVMVQQLLQIREYPNSTFGESHVITGAGVWHGPPELVIYLRGELAVPHV